jgi:hypothetical protein
MSCAFHNCLEVCSGAGDTDRLSFGCPFAGLADGLHAMAQPLTVLRGTLGAWKLRELSAAEVTRYREMSEKQVARLGELLGCMQDFLETAGERSTMGCVDLGELLEHVLWELRAALADWGGTIERPERQEGIQIRGDAGRTERALRAALRAAISITAVAGTLRIAIRSEAEQVEVRIENGDKLDGELSSAARLSLSLIDTNIRSQGGQCEFAVDPLRISIAMPAYSKEATLPAPMLPIAEMHLGA